MIDIVLVYDDLDCGTEDLPGLDYFFESCALNLIDEIITDNNKYSILEIDGKNISQEKIDEILNSRKNTCLFIAYSHGIEEALLYNHQKDFYLKSNINDEKLNGCIFYTWSCLSGKELAKNLYTKGCLGTLSYEEEVWAGTFEKESFISAANSGLKSFCEGNNLEKVIQDMYNRYTELIDYYDEDVQDYFMANLLRKNRDALVYNGNNNLSFKDITY